jgi:hypothetical protein
VPSCSLSFRGDAEHLSRSGTRFRRIVVVAGPECSVSTCTQCIDITVRRNGEVSGVLLNDRRNRRADRLHGSEVPIVAGWVEPIPVLGTCTVHAVRARKLGRVVAVVRSSVALSGRVRPLVAAGELPDDGDGVGLDVRIRRIDGTPQNGVRIVCQLLPSVVVLTLHVVLRDVVLSIVSVLDRLALCGVLAGGCTTSQSERRDQSKCGDREHITSLHDVLSTPGHTHPRV